MKTYNQFVNEELFGFSQKEKNKRLLKAVRDNDLSGIDEALRKGANINFDSGKALTIASSDHDINLIKYLIERGSNTFDHPIQVAIEMQDINFLQYLASKGAVSNMINYNFLKLACWYDDLNIVKYLIGLGVNPLQDDKDDSVLINAVRGNNKLELVKYLIENQGCDINNLGYGVLYVKDPELLKYLIGKGVDIHYGNEALLYNNMRREDDEMVDYLLENGADMKTCISEHVIKNDKGEPQEISEYELADMIIKKTPIHIPFILEHLTDEVKEKLMQEYPWIGAAEDMDLL